MAIIEGFRALEVEVRILFGCARRGFIAPPKPKELGTRVANYDPAEAKLAQKPRPSGTIRTPNYPRLSSFAIAAALTACNGEIRTPMDGDGVAPDPSGRGGTTTVTMGSTAGVAVMPYGGQGGDVSTTVATTVAATGGMGNLAGGAPTSFGGTGPIQPETTGGSPPVDTGMGGVPVVTSTIAPVGPSTLPPISNSTGVGGAPNYYSTVVTPVGGNSPRTTGSTGGRTGTGGVPVATGGGTSVQVFTAPSTLIPSTTPDSGGLD